MVAKGKMLPITPEELIALAEQCEARGVEAVKVSLGYDAGSSAIPADAIGRAANYFISADVLRKLKDIVALP